MRGISLLKKQKRLFLTLAAIFAVLLGSYGLITLYTAHNTLSNVILEKWDGVTIATSFSGGNGTKENPYQISNGQELAYLKQLIEGKTNNDYADKYYILTKDIDLDNQLITAIGSKDAEGNLNIFKGELNGDGYSINNIKVTEPQIIDEKNYYGLFSVIENVNIKNINLKGVTIEPSSTENIITLGVIAGESYNTVPTDSNDEKKEEDKAKLNNISIQNASINLTNTKENKLSKIGGVVGVLKDESTINNTFINLSVNSPYSESIGKLVSDLDSNINNIISLVNVNDFLLETTDNFKTKTDTSIITNVYKATYNNNTFEMTKEDVKQDDKRVVEDLNKDLDDSYNWSILENNMIISRVEEEIVALAETEAVAETPKTFAIQKARAAAIPIHNSGIEGDTVYVNDLESDLKYYDGKNYTDSTNTNIPTTLNKNLYTDSNLVKVAVRYNGTDYNNSSRIGYVNINERQSKYIYYKYYVVENNYITFDLIDNPYYDRPTDTGFNGWITDYAGATISYDDDYYTRTVKIPVTKTNGIPDDISIDFYASWVNSSISDLTTNSQNAWNSAISSLPSKGMRTVDSTMQIYEDVSNLYISDTIYFYDDFPDEALDSSGNQEYGTCYSWNGCTYYTKNDTSTYDPDVDYYSFNGRTMSRYYPQSYTGQNPLIPTGGSAAGLYSAVTISRYGSIAGYYDSTGGYISSGTCNSSSCTYYKLNQFYNSDGSENKITAGATYYYLVTRDTNFVILKVNSTTKWTNNNTTNKPFTLTSIYNRNDYTNYYWNTHNRYYTAYSDMSIENLYIYTTKSSDSNVGTFTTNTSTTYHFYGNANNIKFGRGILRNGQYVNFKGIIGGTNAPTGSSSNITKFKLIIESGYYSAGGLAQGGLNNNNASYIESKGIFGSDYDRVNNDNDQLVFTDCFAGAWGGANYASSTSAKVTDMTFKSGQYGSRKGGNTSGVYLGQRQYGNAYALREATIEGGWFYVINGGPCVGTNMRTTNSLRAYVKGGEITIMFGGAGQAVTYGNRIIQMTDGKIDYALFGGSNAYNDTSDAGTIYGSSYVYVGGDGVVGDETIQSNGNGSLYNAYSGNVFGNGNGKTGGATVGSNDNSTVMIDGNAKILGNVYGGANYGQAGSTSNAETTNVKILMQGGNLKGSIYGGGNNNGIGSTSVKANIDIDVTAGYIGGSVFGGTRTNGTIYGTTNLDITGGTVNTDVYGGGEGGYTNTSNTGTYISEDTNVIIDGTAKINGSVYGGSSLGTVNSTSRTASSNSNSTNVTVNSGTITEAVYGGAKGSGSVTPYVKGNITVNINGGNIGSVYGANNTSGTPEGTINIYLNNGLIGNVFGGANQASVNSTNVFLRGATVTSIFGGSNAKGTVTTSNVNIESGTVSDVYGANNIGGTTTSPNVHVTGGTITNNIYGGGKEASTGNSTVIVDNTKVINVFGGGESANVDESNVKMNNAIANSVYGGSNTDGTVKTSNVTINYGNVGEIYGGNNLGGKTTTSNVNINSGTITSIYGGGNKATTTTTNVNVIDGTITNVFGGGNSAGCTQTNTNIFGGNIINTYGGSNEIGNITESIINTKGSSVSVDATVNAVDATWQSSTYKTYADITVTVKNTSSSYIEDWTGFIVLPESTVYSNYSSTVLTKSGNTYNFDSINKNWGKNSLNPGAEYTFTFAILTNADKNNVSAISPKSSNGINISNIFGGNNKGGVTSTSNLNIDFGTITNIYGGGNEAVVSKTNVNISNGNITDIYGGGNQAEVSTNTNTKVTGGIIYNDIYGGGNYGKVLGNTDVKITDATINGSAYAGGNGSTAIVKNESTITIDGNTIIGTPTSDIPNEGSVFGSGNAASNGEIGSTTSNTVVNIVGGLIYGNVYGGANTSVVYGKTTTNIGTNAVTSGSTLKETDIDIRGTVFGGGESSATSDGTYEGTISVVKAIEINIDGKNYNTNSHKFLIAGSVFGSGHMSSSSGTSNIYISNLGTKANPSKNISIQRSNDVIIDNSVIELSGATDSTNVFGAIPYSFNRINKLTITNNSRLLLQENANRLEELYSTVSVDDPTLAAVTINDETKEVTSNVDNRIYMVANKGGNKNLNITTNEAADEYGRVHGMTFFGLYLSYSNGSFGYGLYDESFTYGSEADAGDEVSGGSYVVGLHATAHDITKDGFYTNYINDSYTEIKTAYIDPPDKETNYYRWTIGVEIINKTISLTASKFSSLGTESVPFLEFANGDTQFNVVGFNSEGLTNGVKLVDSNDVPRLAKSEEEANSTLGLAMKTETSEWTSYGTTKYLSQDNGSYTGDTHYKTDSQQTAPSLMFYLYHAKNITLAADLGTVIITVQVATPINEIEYKIDMVTITILIKATDIGDGNKYDASIAYDKKYEMPSATSVNITNKSQFTAYYSLYTTTESLEKMYGIGNTNYHVLTSNMVLPIGTTITMIDYGKDEKKPEYYYYTVDQIAYNTAQTQLATYNEVTYKLSDFIRMGSTSTNNKYSDSASNLEYYRDGQVSEEYIFIFDFKDTTTNIESIGNTILFELRNKDNFAATTVLDSRQAYMVYNLYKVTNVALQETINMADFLYPKNTTVIDYTTNVTYDKTANKQPIIDTNYESINMGVNVALIDSSNNKVSSSVLTGTYLKIDGQNYYTDSDGVYRIKLSGKVSNLTKKIYLTTDSKIPSGKYKMRFTLFASSDGLHNSQNLISITYDKGVTVAGSNNAIVIKTNDYTKVVDGNTGLNSNNSNSNIYNVTVNAQLTNPNVRVSIMKRNKDNKDSTVYENVDYNKLFTNDLAMATNSGYIDNTGLERIVNAAVNKQTSLTFKLQNKIESGTYKIVFKLYDSNQLIEEDYKYVIVKKAL